MQDLTVIGVEDGALLVSSDEGTRFRIAIDEKLTTTLRQRTAVQGSERRLAPREIQAHIRGGMSAEDVAAVTGSSLEYIQKFEGPVLAEREFVVESALNVPVHTALDIDPLSQGSTFGSVIRERLHDLGATGERWASWKDAESGWIVKLQFSADQIEHDARWKYEPKKAALAPLNNEAHTLSQQGEMAGGLIPRLRAVGGDERAQDSSRFDSGAFDVRGPSDDTAPDSAASARWVESSPEVSAAAIKRAPVDEVASSQTADLLEALRRRRGERESAGWDVDELDSSDGRSQHPATGRIRLIDVPLADFEDLENSDAPAATRDASPRSTSERQGSTQPQPFAPQARSSARKGRAAMPSWDEIVFGARSDDDPA